MADTVETLARFYRGEVEASRSRPTITRCASVSCSCNGGPCGSPVAELDMGSWGAAKLAADLALVSDDDDPEATPYTAEPDRLAEIAARRRKGKQGRAGNSRRLPRG